MRRAAGRRRRRGPAAQRPASSVLDARRRAGLAAAALPRVGLDRRSIACSTARAKATTSPSSTASANGDAEELAAAEARRSRRRATAGERLERRQPEALALAEAEEDRGCCAGCSATSASVRPSIGDDLPAFERAAMLEQREHLRRLLTRAGVACRRSAGRRVRRARGAPRDRSPCRIRWIGASGKSVAQQASVVLGHDDDRREVRVADVRGGAPRRPSSPVARRASRNAFWLKITWRTPAGRSRIDAP